MTDGRSPEAHLAQTLLDLEQRFGAVSCESQTIRGQWRHEGQSSRDGLIRVFVDVPDTPENRQFFMDFKEVLKARFAQLDIWLTTYPLEVL
jgi:hypothetical protein